MVKKTRLKRKRKLRKQRGGALFSSDKDEYIYIEDKLKEQDREKIQKIFKICGAEFIDGIDSKTGKHIDELIIECIIKNDNGEYNIHEPIKRKENYDFICKKYLQIQLEQLKSKYPITPVEIYDIKYLTLEALKEKLEDMLVAIKKGPGTLLSPPTPTTPPTPPITPTSSPNVSPVLRPTSPISGPEPIHSVTGSPIIPPIESTTEGPKPKPKSISKQKEYFPCLSCGRSGGSKKYKKSKRKSCKTKRKSKNTKRNTKRRPKRSRKIKKTKKRTKRK